MNLTVSWIKFLQKYSIELQCRTNISRIKFSRLVKKTSKSAKIFPLEKFRLYGSNASLNNIARVVSLHEDIQK